MSRLVQRAHRGYVGLWALGLILGFGTLIVGILFVADGVGTTSSAAYGPPKSIMVALGAAPSAAMAWWAVVFAAAGLLELVPLICGAGLGAWAVTFTIGGAVWFGWAVMFVSYGLRHDGLGLVGSATWAMIAGAHMVMGRQSLGYQLRPRPR